MKKFQVELRKYSVCEPKNILLTDGTKLVNGVMELNEKLEELARLVNLGVVTEVIETKIATKKSPATTRAVKGKEE